MIKAVVIPAALDRPLCLVEIDPHSFAAYQKTTGGNMQGYELRSPPMMLYSNTLSAMGRPAFSGQVIAWIYPAA